MPFTTEPTLSKPDIVHAALLSAMENLDETQLDLFKDSLILLLMNQLSDHDTVMACIEAAAGLAGADQA